MSQPSISKQIEEERLKNPYYLQKGFKKKTLYILLIKKSHYIQLK
jgi:hypothetical protein